MDIVQFVLGSILISFGRKVVWLMTAALAFLICHGILPILFPLKNAAFVLITSAVITCVLTVIAIFLQKVALMVGGFIGGGTLATKILLSIPLMNQNNLPPWAVFLMGGVIGILLSFFLFNWIIMLLSAFTGSFLILQIFPLSPLFRIILLIPLSIFGAYLQTRLTAPKLKADTV